MFFEKIEGVYQTLVYDNMKVVIRKFVGPHEKEATEALLKLSTYYAFSFRFCNVRRGNEKGHVERSVEYVRRKAFAKQDVFSNLDHANEHLQSTCDQLNLKEQAHHDNQTAVMLLQKEHPYLYPIKPMFECGDEHGLKVDKYSTISYKTCRYSVPEKYNGKIIRTKVYPDKIICYNNENEVVCRHERLHGLHEWSIKIEHYTKTFQKKPGALRGSKALAQIESGLKRIYENYYQKREREFIDLIEYMHKNGIKLYQIKCAIKQLNAVKSSDVTLDKIKILCTKQDESVTFTPNHTDEISNSCYNQLKQLSRLFLHNNNLSDQTMEIS